MGSTIRPRYQINVMKATTAAIQKVVAATHTTQNKRSSSSFFPRISPLWRERLGTLPEETGGDVFSLLVTPHAHRFDTTNGKGDYDIKWLRTIVAIGELGEPPTGARH